jgi:putative flippase GtrA
MQHNSADWGIGQLGKQFTRFAACGAVGTLAHYLLLVLLVQGGGSPPVAASSAGFVLGAVVNYTLNYRYTFHSTQPHRETMWKFFVAALIGALANAALMSILIQHVNLYYLVSQVIATGIVLVLNFMVNRIWTFRG